MLCCCYYAKIVVDSFVPQIQPEYYVGNPYVSIEEISLENFSATTHSLLVSVPESRTIHAVFHSFFMITENNMRPQQLHT